MTLEELRSLILKSLDGLIGEYSLSGQTFPAITFKESFPPSGTTCNGLEVYVNPVLSLNNIDTLNGLIWQQKIEIWLKQWDDQQTTIDATAKLVKALSPVGIVKLGTRLPPLEEIGNIETQKITIELKYRG
ncbi:MAG: hypothetical protein RLZZ176_86 [Cyanobacteriota bacterium]|jgi:hypothetical protein